MDEFLEMRSKLREALCLKENKINSTLETLSENILLEKKLSEKNEYEYSSNDLNENLDKSERNQMNLEKMRQEYVKRQEDYLKVIQFEESFPKKVNHLENKLNNLNEEIDIFDNVDDEKKNLSLKIGNIYFLINFKYQKNFKICLKITKKKKEIFLILYLKLKMDLRNN